MKINPTMPPGPGPIPPMVYVREKTVWQYKLITREVAQALSEEELNALGKEGWELASAMTHGSAAQFYFKRIKD